MNTETEKRETGIKVSRLLMICCFIAYSCAYIARGNFSFARTLMIDGGIIDAGEAGILSAVYFICYALGQVVNGVIADRRSPFVMVIIGLSVVAASNLAMPFLSAAPIAMIIFWGINGVGQSMLWSPVFFIISNVLNTKIRFTAITLISICTPAGKISCAVLSGLSLITEKWQNVFYMASFVIAAVLLLWTAVYLSVKKDAVAQYPENKPAEELRADKAHHSFGKLIIASGTLIMLPALAIYGLFLNGVVELIPSILSGQYHLSSSVAALLESIVPLIGISGVFLCNFVYLRIFKKNEMRSACFLMTVCVLPMLVLLAFAYRLDAGGYLVSRYFDAVVFVVTYGVIYILQLAYGHLVISLVPMRYSKFGLAATMTGLNNAVNYGGSAIATYGMSYAVENLPLWQTVGIWLICIVVAAVFLFLSSIKWTKFSKEAFDD
ncbi:MAG: MFS transporter [Ruminococcaceae bacterium]|nr:MFS transporter [Oscillospiraceae bacterium]